MTEETEKESIKVTMELGLLDKIANYLASRPWIETNGLILEIQNAVGGQIPPAEIVEPSKNGESKKELSKA